MQEAAGYIVYVVAGGELRFLLLRNAKHHTWGFPKGKLEPGEDAHAGALRELQEETGIKHIRPDATFSAQSIYEVPGSARAPGPDDELVKKRARYFLARVEKREFERSPEHDAGDWMTPEEVLASLQHEDLRRVFREALAHLRRSGARIR